MANVRIKLLKWILCLLSVSDAVLGHIPTKYYYDSAEPDAPVYAVISDASRGAKRLSRERSLERVTALRAIMAAEGVDAYIIPTADAHNSQYIAPTDARREWICGLIGSSGTAVVTAADALVWTDGRYFTQFYLQVDTSVWGLMRSGIDPGIPAWLVSNMTSNAVVAIDPTTYTRSAWLTLENTLATAGINLTAISDNLVDRARVAVGDPAPARPNQPLLALTVEYTGRRSIEKISQLLADMQSRGVQVLVMTALDDIAYTLNLRGSDIPYNPVFFSYLVIRADVAAPNNVILYWGNGELSSDVVEHLSVEGVTLQAKPYTNIFQDLRNIAENLQPGNTIWLSQDGSHAIHLAAEANPEVRILSTISPVSLIKCVKNEVELKGFRNAHIKDGVAVVRFLRWVHEQVDAGVNVTEINISDKLFDLRSEEEGFMGASFETIAGAGEHGAVIHYAPSREGEQRVVRADDMLLVDSGGQYLDGTTDITRTRHMSSAPTAAQRLAFTRVLKGQILMGTAVFPSGINGHRLETLARKSLWDVGLDYAHGTGHGVGHYLIVHEGPAWILSGPAANDPGIVAGMVFSNEPGYYEVDEYGVRHEDLVETIVMNKDADHILAEGMVGDFDGAGAVAFYTISLAPHQTACLDVSLLSDFEIKYLNDYHARVLATLGPVLLERNLTDDYEWLQRECAPVQRSAAILIMSTPLLTLFAVFSLWLRAENMIE